MKNEEYKALLASMIADPDKANDVANTILTEIGKDADAAATAAEEAKKLNEGLAAKNKELTDSVNKYKVREFMGTMGQPEKPYDPIQAAVDIAAKIINPHYGEKEK